MPNISDAIAPAEPLDLSSLRELLLHRRDTLEFHGYHDCLPGPFDMAPHVYAYIAFGMFGGSYWVPRW